MDREDEIEKVAYELFEKSGRIEGRNLDNWIEAEKIVMSRHKGQQQQLEAVKPRKRSVAKEAVKSLSPGRKESDPAPEKKKK